MIVFLLTFVLWGLVVVLGFLAWRRSGGLLPVSLKAGGLDFLYLLPRLAIGVIGSGFLAALLPADLVRSWLGPDSGPGGLLLATLAGAFTPGGPVVGFAIGSTAMKSGAGSAAVVAYVTAWALFALQRLFVWELPVMPARVVWLRVAASLPLPFLAAWGFMLAGGR
jgi:uncharacterized membrane protein YraQ (UPF0718 family)